MSAEGAGFLWLCENLINGSRGFIHSRAHLNLVNNKILLAKTNSCQVIKWIC